MKRELFDLHDKNFLFDTARAMHDERLTHIEITENDLTIEYSKIGENAFWKPYSSVTITYTFDTVESDYSLSIIQLTSQGTKVDYTMNDPQKVNGLNAWNMIMFKYDIDLWGEMTLHFNIWKGKKHRNAELRITPATIEYCWKE